MRAHFTQKHLTIVLVSITALFFCSIAMGQQATQVQKATPSSGSNLSFVDSQQAWKQTEQNDYREWLKRNPRYSHPIFQSQWDVERGSTFVDDTPDPNYRGWTYYQPWYQRGSVMNVRGRILWVNDRYPSGKYYSSKMAE